MTPNAHLSSQLYPFPVYFRLELTKITYQNYMHDRYPGHITRLTFCPYYNLNAHPSNIVIMIDLSPVPPWKFKNTQGD